MKTVRFKSVVADVGKPEQYLPWMEPSRDRAFMKAVHENRVMTIQTHNVGTRKDWGLAGFHRGKESSYLIFPRPHDLAPETHVVGIDYALIREPARQGRQVSIKAERKEKAPTKLPKAPPPPKRFRVKLAATSICRSKN